MRRIHFTAGLLVACSLAICALATSSMYAQDYLNPTLPIDVRVADLLSRMTLDEKIGQMMQVDLDAIETRLQDITTYRMGSILSGGDSDPAAGNSALSWRSTHDTVQAYAMKTPLKIPMIYGVDAVHGHSNVVGATIFPHNIGMGCTRDSALIEQAARITAVEMAATGIRWTFWPMVGVPRDERWGRTYEAFGETPELARLGAFAVRGLQGDSLSGPTSVLACAKHYLADGGTVGGVDQGDAVASEETIRNIHLPGYVAALGESVGTVMASFSSINGQKMHGSTYWLTNVLKTELGFKGFVVSDWDGINQLGSDYTSNVETGVNAGIDMAMLPNRYNDFLTAMRTLVNDGRITQARVDDAVSRILWAKFALGLFERPYADTTLLPLVGSAPHRAIARQAARESMVLLKRKDGVLPLPKTSGRVLVAGSHADNLGYQCGGWTITWQGGSGNTTVGTTILQGLRTLAPGVQFDYSATGDFTNSDAEYSLVVIGEAPYAEGNGDKKDLGIQATDVELIKKMKAYGHPLVLVLVSGRPLILEKVLHFADGIVAAWLPGTEGGGVADVLLGNNAPKGVLSHTWPKSMLQIPINIGDANYAPLYPCGHGITSLEDSPTGSAPLFMSGIVTQDGRHIELTFNKAMSDPSSASASFSLLRNGLPFASSVAQSLKPGDSTTILLQIDTLFLRDDTVAVTYTSGSIQALDGGVLAPFGPSEVYNWVRPGSVALPGRIEAENYGDMYGIDIEPTSDLDGVCDITSIDDGDWFSYGINAATSAYYMLSLRVASAALGGSVLFVFDGATRGSRGLPVTGSWDAWTTVKQKIAVLNTDRVFTIRATNGGFHLNWISFDNVTGVLEKSPDVPRRTTLAQNYPNPFNPSTQIAFGIAETGHVEIRMYNVLGQEVQLVYRGWTTPGWYNVTVDASHLPSGMYVYRLKTLSSTLSSKMLVMK